MNEHKSDSRFGEKANYSEIVVWSFLKHPDEYGKQNDGEGTTKLSIDYFQPYKGKSLNLQLSNPRINEKMQPIEMSFLQQFNEIRNLMFQWIGKNQLTTQHQ